MRLPDETPEAYRRRVIGLITRLSLVVALMAAIVAYFYVNAASRRDVARDEAAMLAKCVKPYLGMRIVKDTALCTGLYFLYGDAPEAITIAADGVSLTGRDTRIVGNRKSTGIRIQSNNNTISGCILIGFQQAIVAEGQGSGLTIRHTRIDNVGEGFIRLAGGAGRELHRVTVDDVWLTRTKGGGLVCEHCRDLTIRRVQYMNDEATIEPALRLADCRDGMIAENVIYSLGITTGRGIDIANGSNLTFEANIVRMSGEGEGAHVANSADLTFRYNRFVVDRSARALLLEQSAARNRFLTNSFRDGPVLDQGSGNVWCVNGRGNWFLNGSSYEGPDPQHGTCAP